MASTGAAMTTTTTTATSNEAKRRIAVLGSRSVGKSTLIVRFMENVFVDSYYPTIEATFTKSIKYKGRSYNCDIIDTAGQVSTLHDGRM